MTIFPLVVELNLAKCHQSCLLQAWTGPAEHREIPGGPVAIKRYINKFVFANTLDNNGPVRLNFLGRFGKPVRRTWSTLGQTFDPSLAWKKAMFSK